MGYPNALIRQISLPQCVFGGSERCPKEVLPWEGGGVGPLTTTMEGNAIQMAEEQEHAEGPGEAQERMTVAMYVVEARGLIGAREGRCSSAQVNVHSLLTRGQCTISVDEKDCLHPNFSPQKQLFTLPCAPDSPEALLIELVDAPTQSIIGSTTLGASDLPKEANVWIDTWLMLHEPSSSAEDLHRFSDYGCVRVCLCVLDEHQSADSLSEPALNIHEPLLFLTVHSTSDPASLAAQTVPYDASLELHIVAHGKSTKEERCTLPIARGAMEELLQRGEVAFREPCPYEPTAFTLRNTNIVKLSLVLVRPDNSKTVMAEGRTRVPFLATHEEFGDHSRQSTVRQCDLKAVNGSDSLSLSLKLACGTNKPPQLLSILGAGYLDSAGSDYRLFPQPGDSQDIVSDENDCLLYVRYDNGIQFCEKPDNAGRESLSPLLQRDSHHGWDGKALTKYQVIYGTEPFRQLSGDISIAEILDSFSSTGAEDESDVHLVTPERFEYDNTAREPSLSPGSYAVASATDEGEMLPSVSTQDRGNVQKSLLEQEMADMRELTAQFERQLKELKTTHQSVQNKRDRVMEALSHLAKKLRQTEVGIGVLEKCENILKDEKAAESEEGADEAGDEALNELNHILQRYKNKRHGIVKEKNYTDEFKTNFERLLMEEEQEVHSVNIRLALSTDPPRDGLQQSGLSGKVEQQQLDLHAHAPAPAPATSTAAAEGIIPAPMHPRNQGVLESVLPQSAGWLRILKRKAGGLLSWMLQKVPQRAERDETAIGYNANDMNIQTAFHAIITCVQGYQAISTGKRLPHMVRKRRFEPQLLILFGSAVAGTYRSLLHTFGRPLARRLPKSTMKSLNLYSRVADAALLPMTLVPIGSTAMKSGAWSCKWVFMTFCPLAITIYGGVHALEEKRRVELEDTYEEDPSTKGDVGAYRTEHDAASEREWATALSSLGLLVALQSCACKPVLILLPFGMGISVLVSQVTESRWRSVSLDVCRAALLVSLSWADCTLTDMSAGALKHDALVAGSGATAYTAKYLSSSTVDAESAIAVESGNDANREVDAPLESSTTAKPSASPATEAARTARNDGKQAKRLLKGWYKPILNGFRQLLGLPPVAL